MAGFADVIRSALETVDTVTDSLQVDITHHPWVDSDGMGTPVFDPAGPFVIKAIAQDRQRLVRRQDGELQMTRTVLTFPRPITPNGAAGRQEPIDPRDKLVLPDGTTGAIIDIVGVVDPVTGKPYISEVWLGTTGSST